MSEPLKSSDPLLHMDGLGYMKTSDARNRAAQILAGLANGLLKKDPKAELYAAQMLSSESELSVIIRSLVKAKQIA